MNTAHLIEAGLGNIVIIALNFGKILFIEAKLQAVNEIKTSWLGLSWLGLELRLLKVRQDVLEKLNRSINIKPQLLVGLATDYLMIVQEFWVGLLLGNQKSNHLVTSIENIEATSPLAMNGNMLVIRDKLVAGLNTVCIVAVCIILEEGEFLVGHTEGGGLLYFYIPWDIFLQINNYMGEGQVTRVGLHILI